MKNFIRMKENFKCEHCGEEVVGDGYTDHCPRCLWGKHVDAEIPGDRASECQGALEPVGVEYVKTEFRIKYQCQRCRHQFIIWADEKDEKEKLWDLVKETG